MFFVFAFLVVSAPPLFRDILGWVLVILDVFLGGGVPRRLGGVPLGARSHSKMILGCFLEDFRLHFGTLEGHFGGHFGARFANRSDYVYILVLFFRPRKNERKL